MCLRKPLCSGFFVMYSVEFSGQTAVVKTEYPFDLRATLCSGQFFAWEESPQGYWVCTGAQAAFFTECERELHITPCSPADFQNIWRHFLDMDYDYRAADEYLAQDAVMAPLVDHCRGLHLLNQNPWECLVAFIISANNNITRIRRSVAALRDLAGCDVLGGKAFPAPEALLVHSPEALRACGLGYRSPYLLATARSVAGGFDWAAAREAPYKQARQHLITLSGVGPKVADCVLLFSCGHRSAFPVDTWIEQAMNTLYPDSGKTREAIGAFAREKFGPYGGLAQQYMFHYFRTGGSMI